MSSGSCCCRTTANHACAPTRRLYSLTIVVNTAGLLQNVDFLQGDARRACTFLGWLLSTTVYTTHGWNTCILVITYGILVHPLSSFTLSMERHVLWLFPAIWGFALIVNSFIFGFAGFSYSGGYCYIGNRAGTLFSTLVQFLPRAIVAVLIGSLYTRLFVFLRRTNFFAKGSRRGRSFSKSSPTNQQSSTARLSAGAVEAARPDSYEAEKDAKDATPSSSEHSTAGNRSKLFLPFLRSQTASTFATKGPQSPRSPVFQLGGDRKKQDFDGYEMRDYAVVAPLSLNALNNLPAGGNDNGPSPTATRFRSEYPSEFNTGTPSSPIDHKAALANLGPRPRSPPASSMRRSRSLSDAAAQSDSQTKTSKGDEVIESSNSTTPLQAFNRAQTGGSQISSGSQDDLMVGRRPNLGRRSSTQLSVEREEEEEEDDDDDDDEIPDYHSWIGLAPSKAHRRKDMSDFQMMTVPRETARGPMSRTNTARSGFSSTSPGVVRDSSRTRPGTAGTRERGSYFEPPASPLVHLTNMQQALAAGPPSRRGSAVGDLDIPATDVSRQPFDAKILEDANFTWGTDVTGDRRPSKTKFSGNGIGQDTSTSSDGQEVENTGSTLNRQASALLLLYPLAYLVLFGLSVIRLIRDLANPAGVNRPNDVLKQVSRWLIFAQGALDCIIFKVIESQFRQRMKRKRAKARGEDPGWTDTQKMYYGFKNWTSMVWNRHIKPTPTGRRRSSAPSA